MDFLLDCDEEAQREVFFSVADLLNFEVDLVLFDATSTSSPRPPPVDRRGRGDRDGLIGVACDLCDGVVLALVAPETRTAPRGDRPSPETTVSSLQLWRGHHPPYGCVHFSL